MTKNRVTTISRPVQIGLRLIGIWPGSTYGTVNCMAYIASIILLQYFQYSYVFIHFDVSHISDLIDGLSIALSYTLVSMKLASLWLKRGIFYDILGVIEQDWEEFATISSNISTMDTKANLAKRCSNFLMSFNAVGAFLYVIGGYIIQSTNRAKDPEPHAREFAVRMEFPFETSESPVFEIIMMIQFVHQLSLATFVALLNSVLLTLVLHVSGQIEIMRDNLKKITSSSFLPHSSLTTVKDLVNHHQRIITLANNISDMFSFIALLQFLWNTLVICCIAFAIVSTIGTEEGPTMLTKSVTFYIAISMEAFVFCYAGEYLSAKSKSIGDAVYESLWYNMSPSDCQVLLFIILRSQRSLTITAGNIMDMTLEGFTSIMKVSASYASVLHAMY